MKQTLKIGQKVRVIKTDKSYQKKWIGVESIIKDIDSNYGETLYLLDIDDDIGFYKSELQVITGMSKQPRQFKLLKDTPTAKAGTIYTYTEDFEPCGNYCNNDIAERIYDKEDVENNSDWFEEIFEEPKESKEIEKIHIGGRPTLEEITKISFNKINELIDTVNSLKEKDNE